MQEKSIKVTIFVVHTADGFIARNSEELINWSSHEDKLNFAKETKRIGVMIMGLKTFLTFGKPLKDRLNIVLCDTIPPSDEIPGLLEFKNLSAKEIINYLQNKGYKEAAICGGAYTYTQFLKERLVDEIIITIEPLLFGKGISNFTEQLENVKLSLLDISKLNENTVQLKYKVIYGD